MILVTLGTHEQPFERALDIVAPLARVNDLVIQHGHTPARPGMRARWIKFGAYEEIVRLMKEASAVICHAGVGTILSALGTGKCPVVLPRLKQFGEHVDDHQLQITQTFAQRGIVVACPHDSDIDVCLERARTAVAAGLGRKGDLVSAVASATGAPQGPRARSRAWLGWNS